MQHRRLALAALAAATILGAAAQAARASDDPEAVARGAAWLRAQQDPGSGSLGTFGGDWALTALAAAGVHAADVRALEATPSAQDHYHGVWAAAPAGPGGLPTDLARGILTTGAGGIQTSRITARQNLVAWLAAQFDGRQIGAPGAVNDDVFGLLALHRAGAPPAVRRTIGTFVRAQQTAAGGWSFAAGASAADPDMTGAAIASLCRAGATRADVAVQRALAYLRGLQDAATGGIASPFFGVNTDTTAWVVSGLNACGVDPASWTTATGRTPLDFLVAQQNPDGSFQWRTADGRSDLYASQDAVRALAGEDFSAPPPERAGGLPRWRPAPVVAAGTPVPLTLTIDHGGGGSGDGVVRLCQVTAPTGATIAAVLRAARTASAPAGCIADVEADDRGVSTLNGVAGAWTVHRNGAAATAGERVGLGDLISLAYAGPARPPAETPRAPRPVVLPALQAPPPARAAAAPNVAVTSRRLLLRGGLVTVALACPRGTGTPGCRGVVRLDAHARTRRGVRRVIVAIRGFVLPAGSRRRVALPVRAGRLAGLRRLPERRVRVRVATRDPLTGRIAVTRATLRLRTR
jgi:hypothetical protein